MKKNYATLWALSLCVLCTGISCKDSEKNNPASPDTEELKVEFSLPEGKYEMEVGFKDTIRVKTEEPANKLTYEWKESGKVIGTDTLLVFTPTEEKTYNITLTVKSDKLTTEKACQVKGVNPYQNAMLLVNHGEYNFEWEVEIVPFRMALITPKGHFIGDVIKKVNPDFDHASIDRILPVASANGKLYLLSIDKKTLTTLDARTMKILGTPVKVDLYNSEKISRYTCFIVPNETTGYLFTNTGEIFTLSLADGTLTPVRGNGGGKLDYNRGVPPILYKGKLYALGTIDFQGCRLTIINPATGTIEKNLDFEKCTPRRGVLIGENKLALLSGSPYDFNYEKVYTLSLESKELTAAPDLQYSYHNGITAVPGEDAFIYVTNQKNEVCKYNLADGKSTIIIRKINVPDDTNRLVGLGMVNKHVFVDHEDPEDMSTHELDVYNLDKTGDAPALVFKFYVIHQYKLNQF